VSPRSSPYTGLDPFGLGHGCAAAGFENGWLVRQTVAETDHWILTVGAEGYVPLATKELHAELLDHTHAPAVASGVAYFASRAVDLGTRNVLWRGAFAGPLIP